MKEKSTPLGKLGIFLMPVAVASLFEIPTLAYAYDDHENCKQEHWDKKNQAEFFQKRQIELHDKLALTSVQESAWNKFVNMTKPNEMHKKEDWAEMSKLTSPERLDRMLARTKAREEQMERRVHATKEFYSQLTAAQQKIFDTSFQHREHHGHEGEDEHS